MTAPHMIDPARMLGQALSDASPDLMRRLLGTVINSLLSADADAVCGAEYGMPSPDRANSRNGYRHRDLDTRVGTVDVAIPKLRSGSYFPEWLLERRKRAEAALISVVATCYLLGVSTRRMDKLVQSLGMTSLSKSQVSRMAADLDAQVAAFRTRPLADAGPFTFVAADALTMKVREQGRVVNAVVLVATGVNADGHREVLGVKVATSETKEAWNVFFADLVARGLSGVKLVTSDAHAGLVEAIAANLPGAAWQRCRTHYAANLMSVCPKSAWTGVKAMLHSVYDQPDAEAVRHVEPGVQRRDRLLRPELVVLLAPIPIKPPFPVALPLPRSSSLLARCLDAADGQAGPDVATCKGLPGSRWSAPGAREQKRRDGPRVRRLERLAILVPTEPG